MHCLKEISQDEEVLWRRKERERETDKQRDKNIDKGGKN